MAHDSGRHGPDGLLNEWQYDEGQLTGRWAGFSDHPWVSKTAKTRASIDTRDGIDAARVPVADCTTPTG